MKFWKKPLILLILFSSSIKSFSQAEKKAYIIDFSPVYSSNIISNMGKSLGHLYLLEERQGYKIDSLMSWLSKKEYNRQTDILDSLSLVFSIYVISDIDKSNKSLSVIFEEENYSTSYLFLLSNREGVNSTVKGFCVNKFSQDKKIVYEFITKDCLNKYPYQCHISVKGLYN